ncbi:MAG: major facilitator superfamily 1, partial [Bryobacterales bacterium]|nr:major facilitator superfamily 1 [Bryobacterales bacterium]
MKPNRRWAIAFRVSCAIAISYFDRQTLPVAIAAIQRDIPMSNTITLLF